MRLSHLHACSKNGKIIPLTHLKNVLQKETLFKFLTYNVKKIIDVRSLVNEKARRPAFYFPNPSFQLNNLKKMNF